MYKLLETCNKSLAIENDGASRKCRSDIQECQAKLLLEFNFAAWTSQYRHQSSLLVPALHDIQVPLNSGRRGARKGAAKPANADVKELKSGAYGAQKSADKKFEHILKSAQRLIDTTDETVTRRHPDASSLGPAESTEPLPPPAGHDKCAAFFWVSTPAGYYSKKTGDSSRSFQINVAEEDAKQAAAILDRSIGIPNESNGDLNSSSGNNSCDKRCKYALYENQNAPA